MEREQTSGRSGAVASRWDSRGLTVVIPSRFKPQRGFAPDTRLATCIYYERLQSVGSRPERCIRPCAGMRNSPAMGGLASFEPPRVVGRYRPYGSA